MLELLRILAITMGAAIIGMSAMVFYVYALKVKDNRRAVLPWHVVMISFSYATWVALAVFDQGERLLDDGALTYRLVFALVAGVTGITALIVVLKSLERRTDG